METESGNATGVGEFNTPQTVPTGIIEIPPQSCSMTAILPQLDPETVVRPPSGSGNETGCSRGVLMEGLQDNFQLQYMEDGGKVKITIDYIHDEIIYWQLASICYVLGANPTYKVLHGFLNRIRGKFEVDKIVMNDNAWCEYCLIQIVGVCGMCLSEWHIFFFIRSIGL